MSPLLSISKESINNHIKQLLNINRSKLLFGKYNEIKCKNNELPKFEPIAIYIPIDQINYTNYNTVFKEIFGPFQIITMYDNIDDVLKLCENMPEHLTAAIVSNDNNFTNYIIGNTINGTTYIGHKARTTGAPQNHWFGPAGDPRSAGIGSPESIIQTWSCHREIITDL